MAVGGVLFFGFVLLMVWGSRRQSRIEDSGPAYLFAASTLALAVVLYLAYASFFVLKEVCPLCVTTYIAVIGVFVISGGASSVPMSSLPRRAVRDIRVLVTTPVALFVALVFVDGAASAVEFFPKERRPSGGAGGASRRLESGSAQRVRALVGCSRSASKCRLRMTAPRCSSSSSTTTSARPADRRISPTSRSSPSTKDRPKDVKYLLRHFPLDPKCNNGVPQLVHAAACDAAAAAVMAGPKGTFDKLTDWFFVHQDELSPATVRQAAKDVGGISDFDAGYDKALQEVKTEASVGAVAWRHLDADVLRQRTPPQRRTACRSISRPQSSWN